MSHVKGDPAVIAAEIGREVMNTAARLSKGQTGKIDLNEISVGKIMMSNNIGKHVASIVSDKLDGIIGGGNE
jgi:hypothetical protein